MFIPEAVRTADEPDQQEDNFFVKKTCTSIIDVQLTLVENTLSELTFSYNLNIQNSDFSVNIHVILNLTTYF